MVSSDAHVLVAAQSTADAASPAWQTFLTHFRRLFLTRADQACRRLSMPVTEADAVIQEMLILFITPAVTRFDPAGNPRAYLTNLIMTAADKHKRHWMKAVPDTRTDHTGPHKARRARLTEPLGEVAAQPGPTPCIDTHEFVGTILAEATPTERPLVERVLMDGESRKDVALSLGVDPRTVGRTVDEFIRRVEGRVRSVMVA